MLFQNKAKSLNDRRRLIFFLFFLHPPPPKNIEMTSLLSFLTHHLQVLSLESSHDWYSSLPSHPSLSEFRWLQTRGFNSNYFNQVCSGSSRFSKAHLQGKPFFICSFPPLKKSFVFLLFYLLQRQTNDYTQNTSFCFFLLFSSFLSFGFFFFFTWAVISFLNPSLFSGLFLCPVVLSSARLWQLVALLLNTVSAD